jgi:tight adherence protein B
MGKLIAAIVFMDVLLFSLSFYYLLKDRKERRKKKVLTRLSRNADADGTRLLKTASVRSGLSRLAGSVMDLAALESLLIAADARLSVERFCTLSLGLALLVVLPAVILLHNLAAALVVMCAGLCLPYIYLVWRRKRREQMLVQQLPETLEMIVRALRAGQSVDGALKEIAASSAPPVGTEIRTVYDEMAMGLSFEKALRNLEKRFAGVSDIKIMCTAFIVQRETGGNLSKILAGLADTIRRRFKLRRQVRTLTAEGRTSALILGLLPLVFALVAWVFNPDYIGLLIAHPMGRKLLILAVFFVVSGFTVMRLMTRIEV